MKQRILLLLITLTLTQGCLSRKRVLPPDQRLLPAQSLTRAELMKKLDDRSKSVQRLTATVTLDASGGALKTGVLTEYRQTRGIILVDRPGNIRLRVQAPLALATIADMVSDGVQYRVSIPIRNKFMVGDANAPPASDNLLSNLRPSHLMEGMFVDVARYADHEQIRSFVEEVTQGQRRYYVIQFIDISGVEAQLLEKIWIDRSNLEIARKEIFKGDGRLETDVAYSDYAIINDISFPTVITIQRPIEDYGLKITFDPGKTAFNMTLANDAFLLEQPTGAELVQLNANR